MYGGLDTAHIKDDPYAFLRALCEKPDRGENYRHVLVLSTGMRGLKQKERRCRKRAAREVRERTKLATAGAQGSTFPAVTSHCTSNRCLHPRTNSSSVLDLLRALGLPALAGD